MKYNAPLILSENDSLSKLLKHIEPGSIILEFGCANGRMTRYMKNELGCKVYIVEYEEEAFNDAREYAEDGICGDILQYAWLEKFSEISFDYIIFADVLEHLLKPKEVLTKTKRLLKENGKVLISLPNIAHNDVLINLYYNEFNITSTGLLDETHICFFAENNLKQFCEDAGYSIVFKDSVIFHTGTSEQHKNRNLNVKLASAINQRVHGEIYQHIMVLQKHEYVMEHNINIVDFTVNNFEYQYKLYKDEGEGFHEETGISFVAQSDTAEEYILDKEVEVINVKKLRYDPISDVICALCDFEVFIDNEPVEVIYDGIKNGNTILLLQTDPYVTFELPDNGKHKVRIKGHIIFNNIVINNYYLSFYLENMNSYHQCLFELDKSTKIISNLQTELWKMSSDVEYNKVKVDELNVQLSRKSAELEHCYRVIDEYKNSTIWIITKPIRILLDLLKGHR